MPRSGFAVITATLTVVLTSGWALAITIATVPVGNSGNTGELSGSSAGGYGPDRICGAVGYNYRIGTYEVTAGQYCEFLNKVAATDTYRLYNTQMADTYYGSGISRSGTSGNYKYTVDTAFVNRPVNCVNYWDACRFANWLHNRQPTGAQRAGTTETGTYMLNGYKGGDGRTIQRNSDFTWAVASEDEWYKAAYYKSGSRNAGYWDYPTRSDTAPGRDMADDSGNNANYYGNPCPIQSPYYTTVAGEFQNSASPYGTFDQGGNLWEWNESVVYQGVDYAYRGLRGGPFSSEVDYQRASGRSDADPTDECYEFGFRVVYVPEPASAVLFASGGLTLLRRRSHK